ncbi:UNVERIFIED_CONTAM: Amino acid transporter AVT1I [Sesamum angustifolium]|uniref:Amino acid transporter AVT1I n=1 Tax=Sesamum angustifolium TaxID=2727405 RepID=A0AAW2Q8L6_9LAMI
MLVEHRLREIGVTKASPPTPTTKHRHHIHHYLLQWPQCSNRHRHTINPICTIRGRLDILNSPFHDMPCLFVHSRVLILEGDNLHKLFPNFFVHVFGKRVGGKQAFILLTALVMLPTTWLRNLSLLAYVSAGGILASIVLVATVSWIGAVEGVGFSEKGVLLRCDGLATALSLYTFIYCGHAIFPTLCTSMEDKSQFPKGLQILHES